MKAGLLISLIFLSSAIYPQVGKMVFDTTSDSRRFNNHYYYSATDFSNIDSIELWNYKLNDNYHGEKEDSIRPVGEIFFWRTNSIDDKISQQVYGHFWTARIEFDIFALKDSSYCYFRADRTRFYSSCVPPQVGGDIIKIGNFIFVSRGVCMSCHRYDTNVDYCRPVINYIFSKVDETKVNSLKDLVSQFIIKQGKIKK
jgi:hypothetical protein